MTATRKFGIRRVMTTNQIVAHNVARARELRGWTQEQAAEALAPYLGARLSGPSFSNLERSAVKVDRIKQFSADDLLALSRGFDLPIGFFFTPLPPAMDAGLYAPDAGSKGLDPIVLLDAVLGTPDNLGIGPMSCSLTPPVTPHPRSKREKPSVSPADLADRLTPLVELRAQALLRNVLGDLDGGADLLRAPRRGPPGHGRGGTSRHRAQTARGARPGSRPREGPADARLHGQKRQPLLRRHLRRRRPRDRQRTPIVASGRIPQGRRRTDGHRLGEAPQRRRHRTPEKLTLGDYLTGKWLPAQRSQLRPSTLHSYTRTIELHVLPTLGKVPRRGCCPRTSTPSTDGSSRTGGATSAGEASPPPASATSTGCSGRC